MMTWNRIAEVYPEFVAWAVQVQGPLPVGEVRREPELKGSTMSFGKPPCTCTPGPVVNGHETWIIDPNCPEHGKN